MFLYKIENPEVVEKCNQLLSGITQFKEYFEQVAKQLNVGLPLFASYSLEIPVKVFIGFSIADKNSLDKSKWCIVSKVKNHHCYEIRPRRTNKAFLKEYETLVPEDKKEFSYKPLYDVCLLTEVSNCIKYINFDKNVILLKSTEPLSNNPYAEEITKSEFLKLM